MNRLFFIFLIILRSQEFFTQFTDSFSDGDFPEGRNGEQFKEEVVLSR